MDAPTITVVKDGGPFGHPQADMGNVGLQDSVDGNSPNWRAGQVLGIRAQGEWRNVASSGFIH